MEPCFNKTQAEARSEDNVPVPQNDVCRDPGGMLAQRRQSECFLETLGIFSVAPASGGEAIADASGLLMQCTSDWSLAAGASMTLDWDWDQSLTAGGVAAIGDYKVTCDDGAFPCEGLMDASATFSIQKSGRSFPKSSGRGGLRVRPKERPVGSGLSFFSFPAQVEPGGLVVVVVDFQRDLVNIAGSRMPKFLELELGNLRPFRQRIVNDADGDRFHAGLSVGPLQFRVVDYEVGSFDRITPAGLDRCASNTAASAAAFNGNHHAVTSFFA